MTTPPTDNSWKELVLNELNRVNIKQEKVELNLQTLDRAFTEFSAKITSELTRYNDQLQIHMKRWAASEERLNVAENQVEEIARSTEVVARFIKKLESVHQYMEDIKAEEALRKKLEQERKDKLAKRFAHLRNISIALAIPTAAYGIFEIVSKLITAIGG